MKSVDASFCFDYLRGDGGAVSRGREFDQAGVQLTIAAPALMEVLLEAYRRGGRLWERVLDLTGRLEVLTVDASVADEAARLGADCVKRGASVPNTDLMIAACARLNHQALVTRDSDFQRISGMAIETY
jgi:predicted nucleic acid-binding protein